jgi:hypothetical protein
MEVIHRIRAEFYQKTRSKSREYILRLIGEESLKVKQELEKTKPDPRLVVRKKYPIPESISMKEIHQIREKNDEFGE